MATNLRVSLEPHLVETLRPLIGSTPSRLSEDLSTLLPDESSSASQSTTPPPMIPYALLQSISKWARTEEGETALKSTNPPLDPLAYSMVALLAGARTSPDKKFPTLPRVPSRLEGAAREISDKRAIIAVLNAVLTVICTGAAAWWAAQRTGWRDEWKVLLSLLAATIVAISEIGLYIIWESRRERGRRSTPSERPPPSVDTVRDNKSRDIDDENASEPAHLGHASSQTASSVDPHQQVDRQALRQRASVKPKLSG
ncbi:hypothetical protein EDB85DRAFT_1862227 [Lactarius pseudohatsudake]|nr:hypothetical protein EDB85DRAFT_1862227 [Lactarius pseudohatsudake]